MRPCFSIEIVTPKKVVLNGLWFGPQKPKRVVVWVHGLGSSMFSKLSIIDEIVDRDTAVVAFNNRGFERVVQVRKVNDKKIQRITAGAAHEVFTDCIDDIQGAINTVRACGVKHIFLAGHSTGCQKSYYWASKKGSGVKGIILLAPVSDYAAIIAHYGKKKVERVAEFARALVRRGKPHELIPPSMWPEELADAQRFLSLYTPDSAEEIFSYSQPKKTPTTLRKVNIPTLILWAENDEYADRPAKEIGKWFEENVRTKHRVVIVPKVGHGFRGAENRVATLMKTFMKEG